MDDEAPPVDCGACGTANEAGRKFCKECGEALWVLCASCSTPNTPDSKFCGNCGEPLTRRTPADSEAGPTPMERRLVSVLFVDLVGFTTLSEHRDAEDVRDLLSRYFDVARQVIERHGGLVEKFIGDAVMAVWGTPVAYEDDAERAVRAALELVDAVAALGHDVEIDLAARAGVLTGEAATTAGGLAEGIVVGDMVNTASRLQSAAKPGAVLVGDATHRAASKAVAFSDAGELSLKGKDEVVHAWRALRVIGERGGTGRVGGLEPPFVGRSDELRLVKDLLHVTEREGKARLVSVTGIGGIGKSRLGWEFRKYIDGLTDDVYWHQGRCPAYGEGIAFWALGEMVRMRTGIAETDDPAASRRKLTETVDRYVPDPEERAWMTPRLAHLLGLEDRPSGERDELFAAWRTFFERLIDLGPVVMVFEDLQWADSGLLDFIESILEWSRDRPILIVTLARPELFDRRPTWGTNQRSFSAIRLEPLPAGVITELVGGFVAGLSARDIERIVERSEGVPLYAVETVRMLADRGVLEVGDDRYVVAGDVGDLNVPETLHALIAARLDGLGAQDRALLQDAAVLGQSFTAESLAAVSGSTPVALAQRVKELTRKEFLTHEADPRSPERGQFAFVQSLIREVAYSTLSKAERRRRHLAAAHYLENADDEELAGMVATHYVEAFHATVEGPDAQALAARARDWLGAAADRAKSLGSTEQALSYATRALEITPEGSERAVALARAAGAAGDLGRENETIALYDDAIAIRRAEGEAAEVARLVAKQSQWLLFVDRREAIERAERALADLGPQDEAASGGLHEAIAAGYNFPGDLELALEHTEKGLAVAERYDQDDVFGRLVMRKAHILFSLGRHRESIMLAQGLVDVERRRGDHSALSDALMSLGTMSSDEHPRLALDAFLGGAEEARRSGKRFTEIMGLSNGAEAAIDLGEFERADRLLEELQSRDIPESERPAIAMDRALLAAYRGADDVATAELDGISAWIEQVNHIPYKTWYLRTRASTRLLSGDTDNAHRFALEALEPDPTGMNAANSVWAGVHAALWSRNAERTQQMIVAAKALRGPWITAVLDTAEAGLAAIGGHTDEASEGFARALGAWEGLELPLDYAFCVTDAVAVLPPGSVPAETLERARATLARLRAVALLGRLDAATAPAP